MKFAKAWAICAACSLAVPALAQAAEGNVSEAASGGTVQTAGAASAVLAQQAAPADLHGAPAMTEGPDTHGVDVHGPDAHGPDMQGPGAHGPHFGGRPGGPPEIHAAIETIDDIEGLYIDTGRASELPAFYRSVLSKTHDPLLRNLVLHRLADAQLKPAHADEAIATLKGALDETLVRIDSMPAPTGFKR